MKYSQLLLAVPYKERREQKTVRRCYEDQRLEGREVKEIPEELYGVCLLLSEEYQKIRRGR